MLGNPRRSLRSVLKLTSLDGQSLPQDIVLPNGQHATRASTLNMRQTLDEKHLSKVAHHEPLEILCNGMVNHNYETRHGSKVSAPVRRSFWDERAKPRRTRTSSATFCNFSEDEPLQLSPTGSDLGHHLRSRGQVPASKSIPADDEKISRVCEMQSMPVQCAKDEPDKPNCVSRDSKSKEILHKPCRGNSEVIRKKRPSAEEKLIEDNKAYYKLELKNSKLRSSRYFIPHKVSESDHTKTETICDKANVSFSNTNGEKIVEDCISVKVMEETVVKVKKKQRRSELSVLSDEAESFMFGEPSRQDSSYESTEEEGEASLAKEYNQVYTQNTGGNSSKTKKDGECVKLDESNSRLTPLHCDESSLGSVASSCDTGSTRRKRRTHAEAFIHDNLDYYKFEIPGSRLRHQGSNSPNTSACKSVKESKLVDTNEVSVQVSLSPSSVELGQEEKLENVSHSENVIAPRDLESDHHSAAETGTKHLSAYGSALQGLQYSFELVPESEPWYQTYKRQDEGEEIYFPQCESFRWRTFLLPYEIPSSDIHGSTTEAPALGETGGLRFKKKRRNKYAHLLDSKPRKSPRCHASTLAILSSLRHNRKRRETEKREQSLAAQECSTVDESSQDVSVEAVSSKSEVCDPELAEPFREIEKNFEKLLTTDKEDNLSIDINVQDCELSVASGSSDVPPKFPSTERRRNSHSLRRKSAQSSRKLNGVNSNKQSSEITPVSLEGRRHSCKEQLSGVVCLPKPRSGLDSDVVELLDSCWCFDKDTRNCRDCTAPKCDAMLSLSELSCNSSECSVASTCDSSLFSELLGKNSKSCTKKRKKKKNLTGWPIERHRKKGMKKIAEEDDDCTCDIKCSLDDCNKTEGKLSNVDAVSLVIMDNRDGPVRMPNDVNRAENNVDVSANVVRTAKYVDSTANNSDRVVGDLDRAGDNVDRTSGNSDRVAKSNGRGADNVERKEGTMIESEQSSNLEGRSNLVPNTSDKIGDVENARQNGLSDTNSCITNSCPQVNTTMIGSCRVDSSVNNVVEEPFVKDLRGCEDEDISCGAVSSSSVNTKTTKHGLTRTVSLEASRQSCELQPCVRVTKITNLADMLSYSQGAVVANSRRLRSASSPSTMSSPPRRSQEYDVQPRRASPRKRVSKGWDVLISKKR